jgi:hypothetical protein
MRRVLSRLLGSLLVTALALGCDAFGRNAADASDAGAQADAGSALDGGPIGKGCGVDPSSGLELCVGVSSCPNVVLDPDALPGCGYRIRGSAVDLACLCSGMLCSMGTFTTCAEASKLITEQTTLGVCAQSSEGRCAVLPTTASPSGSSTTNPACDRECMRACGGGAACASVCNCD